MTVPDTRALVTGAAVEATIRGTKPSGLIPARVAGVSYAPACNCLTRIRHHSVSSFDEAEYPIPSLTAPVLVLGWGARRLRVEAGFLRSGAFLRARMLARTIGEPLPYPPCGLALLGEGCAYNEWCLFLQISNGLWETV